MRAQTSGVIANFGSLGSWRSGPAYTLYSATKWACSGVSEGLREELKEFGIRVTVIEPGYFRSGFLNPGARVQSATRMRKYDEGAVGQVRKALEETNNEQPGDVAKGAEVIVDVLTGTGVAKGKEMPVRLVLGRDCDEVIRGKCGDTIKLLDEWKEVVQSTDYAEEQ